PLAERRTQPAYGRRASESAGPDGLGVLDTAAIERVCEEAWPRALNADELHEALLLVGVLPEDEARRCAPNAVSLLEALAGQNRAGRLGSTEAPFWVAAERWPI